MGSASIAFLLPLPLSVPVSSRSLKRETLKVPDERCLSGQLGLNRRWRGEREQLVFFTLKPIHSEAAC